MTVQCWSPKYTRALFTNVFPLLKMHTNRGINYIANRCYVCHFSLQVILYDAIYLRKCFCNLSNVTKYYSERASVIQRYKPRLCTITTIVKRRKRNIETLTENIDMLCSYRIKTKWQEDFDILVQWEVNFHCDLIYCFSVIWFWENVLPLYQTTILIFQ